jgi:hypothetical protein
MSQEERHRSQVDNARRQRETYQSRHGLGPHPVHNRAASTRTSLELNQQPPVVVAQDDERSDDDIVQNITPPDVVRDNISQQERRR